MFIFVEKEIQESIQMNEKLINIIEEGFSKLAHGEIVMPPIMRVDIAENNGEVDVKSAYIRGYDHFAIKVSSGFFDNHRLGLPSGNGLMLLLSTKTGVPKAALLDNGYLTHLRTAAAGAIAAKYLAKQEIITAGVIGAGTQSRQQMKALYQVRPFQRLLVYAPTQTRIVEFQKHMASLPDIEIIIASSAEEVVRQSEVVVTTTPAQSPIVKEEWLHSGLHITAMGSDAEQKQELEVGVLSRADRLICDAKVQCFRLGELHHGVEQGVILKESPITELGEITSGVAVGRTDDQQITVCDLTGTGVQDTAIAVFAYERLRELGLGTQLTG